MCKSDPANIVESVIDVGLQYATYGTVGFDKDSKFGLKKGVVTKGSIDGLKEITGAKAAEEANNMARQQMEEQRATTLNDRENAKKQDAANQLTLSNRAGGIRNQVNSSLSTSRGGNRYSTLGGEEQDFLGL